MPLAEFLAELPSPAEVQNAMRRCAQLDVIHFSEDDSYLRCYDYQPNWSEGIAMAKYDDGGGNYMFIFFRGEDAIIKGFDHESEVSPHARDEYAVWPGIYEGIPAELNELLNDAAVEREDVTFCLWHKDGVWHCGTMEFPDDEDDGSEDLLYSIHLDADEYLGFIEDYTEREFDLSDIEAVYAGKPIDAELIRRINPDRNAKEALTDLAEMGNG